MIRDVYDGTGGTEREETVNRSWNSCRCPASSSRQTRHLWKRTVLTRHTIPDQLHTVYRPVSPVRCCLPLHPGLNKCSFCPVPLHLLSRPAVSNYFHSPVLPITRGLTVLSCCQCYSRAVTVVSSVQLNCIFRCRLSSITWRDGTDSSCKKYRTTQLNNTQLVSEITLLRKLNFEF